MMRPLFHAAVFAAALSAAAAAETIAPTPPMGWNSWDAFGLSITEDQFKANVAELAKLKSFGWTYAVIDEGWYMDNPSGAKLADRKYQLDGNGLLIPSLGRFPSAANGTGLKPIGDFVHAQGLKFGVHVVRGIPKQAVDANLPVSGSGFHAQEAADTSDTCPWDDGNYGVKDNAAGQAYYDSMVKQFADWGVDYIKIDCISDHPYKPTEIRQVSDAIKHSGRQMVLSLSPGPTNISHATEVGALAQMWRIADDTWDGWSFAPKDWPNGILTGFKKLSEWHSYAKPGNWPDADMLPFGSLRPTPGWGEPRASRLTVDEEKTLFTLWAIARSPLILGGNLTELPDHTKKLITNKTLITVNQNAWESYPVEGLKQADARIWMAMTGAREKPHRFMAVFNVGEKPLAVAAPIEGGGHALVDLWTGKRTKTPHEVLHITLPAHGSAVFRVE